MGRQGTSQEIFTILTIREENVPQCVRGFEHAVEVEVEEVFRIRPGLYLYS